MFWQKMQPSKILYIIWFFCIKLTALYTVKLRLLLSCISVKAWIFIIIEWHQVWKKILHIVYLAWKSGLIYLCSFLPCTEQTNIVLYVQCSRQMSSQAVIRIRYDGPTHNWSKLPFAIWGSRPWTNTTFVRPSLLTAVPNKHLDQFSCF